VRNEAIARNYAETLLELANRNGGLATAQAFAAALDALAELLESEPRIRVFLETPRVSPEAKKDALRAALQGQAPELFLRFVQVVVDKRRQGSFGQIARAYQTLIDEAMGRTRAHVTLSHPPDAALQADIQRALETRLGRTVVPTFVVDPQLLGGLVVRVGEEVLDGSVRSRAAGLRRRMLEADIPSLSAY
jgi:F-type H+-transporting ATPase subunit delta